MLRQAVAPLGLPVLGAVPRDPALALPDRHLGLVQAAEHERLEAFVERRRPAPEAVGRSRPARRSRAPAAPWRPMAARATAIAAARPADRGRPRHRLLLRLSGAARPHGSGRAPIVSFFSPLADEAPAADADAVYLPGGYPELHGGRLAAAGHFKNGLRAAAARGAAIYRRVRRLYGAWASRSSMPMASATPWPACCRWPRASPSAGCISDTVRLRCRPTRPSVRRARTFRGHEFHYATILREEGEPLFGAINARGESVGPMGLRRGRVAGSFCHLIDSACTSHRSLPGALLSACILPSPGGSGMVLTSE